MSAQSAGEWVVHIHSSEWHDNPGSGACTGCGHRSAYIVWREDDVRREHRPIILLLVDQFEQTTTGVKTNTWYRHMCAQSRQEASLYTADKIAQGAIYWVYTSSIFHTLLYSIFSSINIHAAACSYCGTSLAANWRHTIVFITRQRRRTASKAIFGWTKALSALAGHLICEIFKDIYIKYASSGLTSPPQWVMFVNRNSWLYTWNVSTSGC